MIRKVLLPTAMTLLVAAASLWARGGAPVPAQLDLKSPAYAPLVKIVTGDEPLPASVFDITPVYDDVERPRRDPPVGQLTTYGRTYYDYQHNGTISKMVHLDTDGGVHFTYMRGYVADIAGTRRQFYNFLDEGGNWLLGPDDLGGVIDNGTRSGYGMVTVLPADNRAMPIYHVLGHVEQDRTYLGSAQSADFARGFGAFSAHYPSAWNNVQLAWPKADISRNNITHMTATENGGEQQIWQRVAYWRGTPTNNNFEEWQWLNPPINVDTAGCITSIVSASPTSNRVVVAWHHNRVGANLGAWDGFRGAWQRNNDIRYIVSENGRDFDWQNGIRSLTNIIPIDPELVNVDRTAALGDTFRPYTDVDIQFDPWGDEGLYAAFSVCGFWENPEPGGDPVTGVTGEHDYLLFWNGQEDTITFVFDGWYFNRTANATRTGAWRMNADRPSIAFDPEEEGKIYLVWVNFPKIMEVNEQGDGFDYLEGATDTSTAGYNNAEIMVSISTDFGITWREPINITNTRWEEEEAPQPGQCQSENWPSVSARVDDALHITYIKDLDAGGIPQNEGTATNNPVIYQRIPLDQLDLNDPVALPTDGWIFHNHPQARPQIDERSVRRSSGMVLTGQAVQVTATVVPGGANQLPDDGVLLLVSYNNGEEQAIQMARVQGDVWGASIPGQDEGTTVYYRIQATNSVGLTSFSPQQNYRFGYVVRNNGGLRVRDVQFRPANWETDYSIYRGYEVTLTGVVTTPSSFAQTYGAYVIQDAAAGWSGIMVRGVQQELQVGARVRVTGTVMEQDPQNRRVWEFCTYIQTANIEVLGQENPPAPVLVGGVSDLTFARRAEELEGVLVRLLDFEVDTLSGINPDATQYWPITDRTGEGWFTTIGLTEGQIGEANIRSFRQGTTIQSMTGIFTENNGRYALAPRSGQDIGPADVREPGTGPVYGFALHPSFPNPFNGRTTVGFELSRRGRIELGLYDMAGRLIADVTNGNYEAGRHNLVIDASELPSGVYMLRLEAADGRVASRKLALVK